MQLEDIVKSHTDQLLGLQENINSIRLNVQSLTQENKYVREKIDDISSSIKKLLDISIYFHEQKKEIADLNKEVAIIKEQTSKFEKRFNEIDLKNKFSASWRDFIAQQWWKILLIITPIVAFLFEIGVYLRNLPVSP